MLSFATLGLLPERSLRERPEATGRLLLMSELAYMFPSFVNTVKFVNQAPSVSSCDAQEAKAPVE